MAINTPCLPYTKFWFTLEHWFQIYSFPFMLNNERRVVSYSWNTGRKTNKQTKIKLPSAQDSPALDAWQRSEGMEQRSGRTWNRWRAEIRERARAGVQTEGKAGREMVTQGEQPPPRCRATNSHVFLGGSPGCPQGTCTTLCSRSSAPALRAAHSAPFTPSDSLVWWIWVTFRQNFLKLYV